MAFLFAFLIMLTLIRPLVAEFQVKIKNIAGNTYNISCAFVAQVNSYGTSVKTTTVAEDWVEVNGNEYNWYFQRLDSSNAQGGRCETAFSDSIYGDGIFTAHIYIHSTVPSSSGVFTVAMMTDPFSENTELDLFVANLADNVLKTGQPHEAVSVPLSLFVQQWVTVSMTKKDGYCSTNFYSSSGSVLYTTPKMPNCYTDGVPHQIVVNVRSRDEPHTYNDAFVSIDSITWQQI